MAALQLHLASRSPRRSELLAQLGITFDVLKPDVDERWDGSLAAEAYVLQLARAKAEAGWLQCAGSLPVLAADTAVVLDDEIFGKPGDEQDALSMLARLSARTHEVYTGVALRSEKGMASRVSKSRVTFRALSDQECRSYWQTGEPADKAGGYAIQGLAAVFVENLEGSYSGAMG